MIKRQSIEVQEEWQLFSECLEDTFREAYEHVITMGHAEEKEVEEMKKALDLYYEMAGWDVETGVPREARLHLLNIADLSQF